MYLRFTNVEIEGFQSIGESNINLDNQGIVFIKGINEYDDLTDSNGSGKSSIFESIYWAIFGKTTKGVSKVANRYTKNGCCVTVSFNIDSDSYVIRRSISHKDYGTSLDLIQNGTSMAGRNKTDTEKLIQNSILKEFDQDIFLSIVFLSQGYNNRLSVLSPSSRKDRLESLAQLSVKISEFKSSLSSLSSDYQDKDISIRTSMSSSAGKRATMADEINRLERVINEANNTVRPDIDPEISERDVKLFTTKSDELRRIISDLETKRGVYNSGLISLRRDKDKVLSKIAELSKLLKTSHKGICPTCERPIDDTKRNDMVSSYKTSINEYKLKLIEYSQRIEELEKLVNDHDNKISSLKLKLSKIVDSVSRINNDLVEYYKVRDVSDEIKRVEELKAKIHDLDKQISDNELSHREYTDLKTVADHCVSLVTKQFRNYLLQDVIDFMNSRLFEYSRMLYSNDSDIIRLQSDSSKLDIYLGDAPYDTLSGGEGRKADLALSLAQRDLALRVSGSSSNILILDEIMDNLDDKAISAVASMFVSVADDVDSMFVISHKQPDDIPYDSIMTVVKGSDKISTIMRS